MYLMEDMKGAMGLGGTSLKSEKNNARYSNAD